MVKYDDRDNPVKKNLQGRDSTLFLPSCCREEVKRMCVRMLVVAVRVLAILAWTVVGMAIGLVDTPPPLT